jgi:hypothetical protein
MARNGKYSIELGWLNSLGGWEFWNFTARKTFGENITDAIEAQRDIFNDWDTDFIAGTTEFDTLSLNVREQIIVRSQFLTLQQIQAIKNIKTAIKVIDTSTNTTVSIDRGSFQYATDAEKQYSIEFIIRYPGTIIQSQ